MTVLLGERFAPRRWACRLGVTADWTAYIDDRKMRVDGRDANIAPVLSVTAQVYRGWIWSRLHLTGISPPLLRGLSHLEAARFVVTLDRARADALARIQAELHAQLRADHDRLVPLATSLGKQVNVGRYLAARDRQRIVDQALAAHDQVDDAEARVGLPQAESSPVVQQLRKALTLLQALCTRGDAALQARNARFVEDELLRWREFFDHCEERPLTDEQARAAITFEENTLLVAAAGSGKTSTVVGKVAYALAKGIARPSEVLCLAFNSKAAQEIGERLARRLRVLTDDACPIDTRVKARLAAVLEGGAAIESRTFHSLGLKIIREVDGRGTKVSSQAQNARRLQRAVERCCEDPVFALNWLQLQTVARFPEPADTRFRSEHEYREYLRGIWRQRKFGRGGDDDGILTLGCTKPVRSFEEAAISNWLYVMGVPFEYEAAFGDGAAQLCPGRQWTPDFSYRIRDAAGNHLIVHEHFALNAQGEAPAFFSDPAGYAVEAARKQEVLAALDPRHFWTTSAQYRDGTLFPRLAAYLRGLGIELKPRRTDDVLERLKAIGQVPDLELVDRAVSQIRQNGWTRETLNGRLREQPEPSRARLFLDVVWPLADTVNALLVEDKQLDFDEMIRRALEYLSTNPGWLGFKFILADEFQDTAPGRGDLVRRLLHAQDDSLFFAVGDDWQAINRFAGSDLTYFNGFGAAFNRVRGADKRCDLSRTFRSNQGIADAARTFVLRNPSQLPKEVRSHDPTAQGVIDVITYQNDSEVLALIEQTLEAWVERHPRGPGQAKPSVFLLGRYGETRIAGLSEKQLSDLSARWADRVELIERDGKPPTLYMTMHRSKGLQADYVLILGLFRAEHDLFCFPSEREDDPLLQLVLPPKEAVADADERRLFYVAMTRAKHQVAVLASKRYPSAYALELLRDQRDGSVLFNGEQTLPPVCRECRKGLVLARPKRDGGEFFACTDRWGCKRTWSTCPSSP